MSLQELPHQVEIVHSPEEPGSETCIIGLAGGDYVTRTVHASHNGQRYQTDYYWSVREQYSPRLQAACEHIARLTHSSQQQSIVSLQGAARKLREDSVSACGQALAYNRQYSDVRSLVHIMPRISIFWEHAELPPSRMERLGTFGSHRNYNDLADLTTHEMSTTHQQDGSHSETLYLLRHCGSFTVRRAAEMSMEIFNEIDNSHGTAG